MSDLTANPSTQKARRHPNSLFSHVITNTVVQYFDAVAVLDPSTGYARNFSSSPNQRFLGLAEKKKTGDGTVVQEFRDGDVVYEKLSVAGGADTIADVDKTVYATTNNPADLSFARPASAAVVVGYARARTASNQFDVAKGSDALLRHIHYDGAGRRTINLGTYALADGSSGAYLVPSYKLRGAGRLKRFYSTVAKKKTATNSETSTLQPEIDGTLTTGGSMVLSAVTTAGALASGTAITALNLFRDNSTLKIKQTAGVHTSGWVNLFLEYEY